MDSKKKMLSFFAAVNDKLIHSTFYNMLINTQPCMVHPYGYIM